MEKAVKKVNVVLYCNSYCAAVAVGSTRRPKSFTET